MAKGPNCWNRNVVNVKNRLYSPAYDWDGDAGEAWNELKSRGGSMCFFDTCTSASYNAWIDATDNYFRNVFIPHYKKVRKRADAIFGGAVLGQNIIDIFNKSASLIDSWSKLDKSHRSIKDDFLHPTIFYWVGETRGIVNYFDEAACLVDLLNVVAAEDLESEYLAETPPERTVQPVEGRYLGGSGQAAAGAGGGDGTGKAIGLGLGVVAAGAGAFFLYKVLSE